MYEIIFSTQYQHLVQNNGTDLCCSSSKFIIGFEDAVKLNFMTLKFANWFTDFVNNKCASQI